MGARAQLRVRDDQGGIDGAGLWRYFEGGLTASVLGLDSSSQFGGSSRGPPGSPGLRPNLHLQVPGGQSLSLSPSCLRASREGRSQPEELGSRLWKTGRAAGPQNTSSSVCLGAAVGTPGGGVRDARHAWVVPGCLLHADLGVGRDLLLSRTSGPLSDELSPH